MISKERKKFGLVKRARVKEPNPLLNNVVMVVEGDKADTCTIGFNEDLVHFVGKLLPRGIAKFDPAYLIVTEQKGRGWLVQASYYKDDIVVDLWLAKERPLWLKSFTK